MIDLGYKEASILTIETVGSNESKAVLSLRTANSNERSWTIGEPGAGLSSVYIGLLNADSTPDIVINLGTTACGIAGWCRTIVVLLSNGISYDAYELTDWNFEISNFVQYSPDAGVCLLQTIFVEGEPGLDGMSHNYWASRLLRIGDSSFTEDPTFGHRWIWFSDRSNHRETNQLSGKQKERLWQQHSSEWKVVRLNPSSQ